MKRLLSFILIILLVFSVASAETEHSKEYYEALDKVLYLSTEELKEIRNVIDGILLVNEKMETINSDDTENWSRKYFVDSFKEPTDERYITPTKQIIGTFSNSAATNRELRVEILVYLKPFVQEKIPEVTIELYEYGDNRVNNIGSNKNPYSLYIREDNGNTTFYNCYMLSKGNRIYIDDSLEEFGFGSNKSFMEIIKNSKSVKFRITDDNKYSNSSYSFQIEDTTGFEDALNWLMSDEK